MPLHVNVLFCTAICYSTWQVEPSWAMLDKFLVYEQQPAMALDCLKSTHPVSTRVDNPSQISEVFDSISYSKGKYRHKQLSGCRIYCWFPYLLKLQKHGQTRWRNFTGFLSLMGPMLSAGVRWVCISSHWDLNMPMDKWLKILQDTLKKRLIRKCEYTKKIITWAKTATDLSKRITNSKK